MEKISEIEREKLIFDAKSAVDGQPIDWFDELYHMADRDSKMIPWAKMAPNHIMMDWVQKNCQSGRALIIGCGLGDDAIGLERLGFGTFSRKSSTLLCNESYFFLSVFHSFSEACF